MRTSLLWPFVLLASLTTYVAGCKTGWHNTGSFSRTTETRLVLRSTPSGSVYLNNRYFGETPLTLDLQYQQRVEKKTRAVSYWHTQPGWSLFVSILSLGTYLPFSAIPVDTDTAIRPLDKFEDNLFVLEVRSDHHVAWRQKVQCSGQEEIVLERELAREQIDRLPSVTGGGILDD